MNEAALDWGALVAATFGAVVAAYLIGAWLAETVWGPRNILLPATLILAVPCARALRQRNVLRTQLRKLSECTS
ncbi:hypothetical protein ACFOYW_00510 [Gryllotalpicola reticulitermitis]|uniref:Uncharacterized protein n=1 Tax=Gryllotalpicola reticulitermitis TaxID=1184153 RepID=A0ABV8Q056_9MICO